jgi:hypothetical protein
MTRCAARGAANAREPVRPRELLRRLGGHPAARLGIELAGGDAEDAELWRWLVAACLLADRLDETRVARALDALEREGLGAAAALAAAAPARIAAGLSGAGHPHAERRAAQLARAAHALTERHAGSLARLADRAEDLEALGGRLASLGPGLGAATARRFLEPLRNRFAAAAELPLSASARAAADHLGLLPGIDADALGWPALCRAAASDPDPPAPADLEAALARLGSRACLRARPERCPLKGACPLRSNGNDGGTPAAS